uniref:Glutaredoxin domain-containing protein n=1 Tax=Rhizochromulina marina TaxID=1034831 RepID=A0A7S2SKC0_9STRA|mmetsp:Transcript_31532/g.91707  ORF Transcript_31532/g.91707 Transcript_31532/m.91707 type:complete len:108 (+) Transcript_31532:84-407(+)
MGLLASRPSGSAMDIESTISENDMVVFATSTCPFCAQAISRLQQEGFEPKVIYLDGATRSVLASKTGQTSVPQVFVKSQFIGGCNDGGLGGTLPLLANGTIKEMMES